MGNRFEGKVAIVTGAGSGLGRETAKTLAAGGASVVVADLSAEGAQATVDLIIEAGGAAVAVIGDVSDQAIAEELVATAVSAYGALHILVNNAGIVPNHEPRMSWDVDEAFWDRVLRVNLRSVHVCSRAAVSAMRASGGGSIVNTASIAAMVNAGGASYAASKAGILGYARTLANELAPEIRVNCVSPGFILTPMAAASMTPDEIEASLGRFRQYIPMGRFGDAGDIADVIAFLASSDARYVTGQEIVVDGGHLVHTNFSPEEFLYTRTRNPGA